MTAQILFNQLAYTDRLKRGGFSEDQARASVEALGEALTEAVATKSDIQRLEVELRASIKTEIEAAKSDLLFKMFGIQVAIAGFLFAALKFIH